MADKTWMVRVDLCDTGDAVHAEAVVVDGPVRLSGHGRAAVGARGRATAETEALAARRSLVDLAQSIKYARERPHLDNADQA
jgi:hypothetical protein